MKYGQTDLNQRWNDIFCRRPSKAGFTIQVYLVCPFHCPLYNTVLAHDNVQEVFCTFSFAHISMQLIFAVNFHIFERIAYLLVNVSADKVLCIRRLSSHCQSNVSHVRFIQSSLILLSVSSGGGPSNLSYKAMLKKVLLDHNCEHTRSQRDNFMNHERLHYYVEILYTSVSRLCPRR